MPRPFANFFRFPTRLRRRASRSRKATMLLVSLVVVVLILPMYAIYKPPSFLIRYFTRRWPEVIFEVTLPKGAPPAVALTIDDAPSEHTREILSVLAAHDAKATFFIIGAQVRGREELLREIIVAGHELGNHAMRDEPARALSVNELASQIRDVQSWIEEAYVAEARASPMLGENGKSYFRPGSGLFNDRMRAMVKRLGFRMVLGSIYPHDAQIEYPAVNARHVLSMLRPGGIIICHDRRSWTVPMLQKVLPKMKSMGYRAVTMSQLLAEATPQ